MKRFFFLVFVILVHCKDSAKELPVLSYTISDSGENTFYQIQSMNENNKFLICTNRGVIQIKITDKKNTIFLHYMGGYTVYNMQKAMHIFHTNIYKTNMQSMQNSQVNKIYTI